MRKLLILWAVAGLLISIVGVVRAARDFRWSRQDWLTATQETSITNAVSNRFGAGCDWETLVIRKTNDPARSNTEHMRLLVDCEYSGETSIDNLPAGAVVK